MDLKKKYIKLQSSFKSEKNANCFLNIFNAFILFFPIPSQSDQIFLSGQRETAACVWL